MVDFNKIRRMQKGWNSLLEVFFFPISDKIRNYYRILAIQIVKLDLNLLSFWRKYLIIRFIL